MISGGGGAHATQARFQWLPALVAIIDKTGVVETNRQTRASWPAQCPEETGDPMTEGSAAGVQCAHHRPIRQQISSSCWSEDINDVWSSRSFRSPAARRGNEKPEGYRKAQLLVVAPLPLMPASAAPSDSHSAVTHGTSVC